jgi:hypothetical protein
MAVQRPYQKLSRVFAGGAKSDILVSACRTGLPDGKFSNQKSQFGSISEGLAMEDVGMFYDHLVYFTTI